METPPTIDRAFFDEVDAMLKQTLAAVDDLTASAGELQSRASTIPAQALSQLQSHLSAWQERLLRVTQETAEMETELASQEAALRAWFDSITAARYRIAQSKS